MADIQIGDKVVMNDKYYVSDKNKGVEFTVKSEPFDLCGTTCVMLENYKGAYALDGLTKVCGCMENMEFAKEITAISNMINDCKGRGYNNNELINVTIGWIVNGEKTFTSKQLGQIFNLID